MDDTSCTHQHFGCGALLYRNVKHVQFDDLMSTAERQAALAAFRWRLAGVDLVVANVEAAYMHLAPGTIWSSCCRKLLPPFRVPAVEGCTHSPVAYPRNLLCAEGRKYQKQN